MRVEEIEAEAMSLPEPERARLANRLFASLREWPPVPPDDPIRTLGTDPVDMEITDGSANHDFYLYGSKPA